MSASERVGDRDGLVLREEAVLGYESVSTDVNLLGRTGVEVVHPVSVGTPRGANHDLAGTWIVGENHCDGFVRPPRLPSRVDEQQEGATERPAPSAPVETKWDPEHGERQPTWRLPQAEERSSSTRPLGLLRELCRHRNYFAADGNSRRRST